MAITTLRKRMPSFRQRCHSIIIFTHLHSLVGPLAQGPRLASTFNIKVCHIWEISKSKMSPRLGMTKMCKQSALTFTMIRMWMPRISLMKMRCQRRGNSRAWGFPTGSAENFHAQITHSKSALIWVVEISWYLKSLDLGCLLNTSRLLRANYMITVKMTRK